MSDDSECQPTAASRTVIVSFREITKINSRLDRIDSRLDLALKLPDEIASLQTRVTALETERAVRDAKGGVYGKALDLVWGLGLAIIAAGVWWPHH